MSRYEKYKDSGINWIGEVPFDWKVRRIKDFFAILGGNGFPDIEQGNETAEIPFLKVSDINSENYEVSTSINYVDRATVLKNGWNIIPTNSIIIGKIGEALKKNHRKINIVECLSKNVSNYSVPNLAISDKAFKTFCPDLIVVSITDLKIVKPSAPWSDLN